MKKVSNIGWKRPKKSMLRKGDEISQDIGYTIETKKQYSPIKDTLWRNLPKNYKLKGKIVSKDSNSQYQGKPANEYKMERISESPKTKRLRKNYLVWQLKDGTLIK